MLLPFAMSLLSIWLQFWLMGCDERFVIAECSGEATKISGRVDWFIYNQCLCGGVGVCGRFWIRWVGEHHKLCAPDWHIWALHQVLPVPSTTTTHGLQHNFSSCSNPPPSPSPALICPLSLSIIPRLVPWAQYIKKNVCGAQMSIFTPFKVHNPIFLC